MNSVFTDEVRVAEFYNAATVHEWQYASTDISLRDSYTAFPLYYRIIDRVNRVLEALPNVKATTAAQEATKNRVRGEALFLRAFCHFELYRFYSNTADGAILLDTNFQLLLINPAAREIFGWEDREIIGQNVLHLFPSELTVKLTKPLYQIAAGEPLQNEETANQNQKNAVINQENNNYAPAEFRLSLTYPKPCTIRILLTQVFDQYRENVRGIAMTLQDITRETELNEEKDRR